jgi:hypothetical protein
MTPRNYKIKLRLNLQIFLLVIPFNPAKSAYYCSLNYDSLFHALYSPTTNFMNHIAKGTINK